MRLSSRPWLTLFALAGLVGLVTAAHGADAGHEKRLALVVGNAAYRADPLATGANDAGLVAEALAQDGFAVTAVADPDAATLRNTVDAFAHDVREAGGKPFVVVYLSGQGVQFGGANYIVPVDAAIDRQAEVPEKAVPFSDILNRVEAVPAAGRVFVFDLAHANAVGKGEPIPLAPGLRHMQPTPGSVYAFNAAPGLLGRPDAPYYGVYARALAEALRTPGFDVPAALSRVRVRVAETTGGAVVPWNNGELDPELRLYPEGGSAPPAQIAMRSMSGLPASTVYWAALAEDSLAGYQAFLRAFPNDVLTERVRAMEAVRLEAASWAEACHADSPAAYWTYMRRYPRGPHYVDVRRRLASIKAALEPPMRFDPTELGGLPTPSAEQIRLAAQAGGTVDDAAWVAVPPAPDELLPPPPPVVYAELAPPPLVPAGTLPVAAPLPGGPSAGLAGAIRQPAPHGLADLGPLTVEAKPAGPAAVSVTATSDDGLITKTATKLDSARRTIVQTDAADEVVSWTTVGAVDGDLAIAQTGPAGEVLSRQITRVGAQGDSATVLTNGAGRLVAETKTSKGGRILTVTFGPGRLTDPSFVLTPRSPAPPPSTQAPAAAEPKPSPPAAASSPRPAPPPPAAPAPAGPQREPDKSEPLGARSEVQPAPPPAHETLGLRGGSPDVPGRADAPPPPAAPPETPGADTSGPVATAPPATAPDPQPTPPEAPPLPVRKPAGGPPKQRAAVAAHRKTPLVYMRGRHRVRR